jgi:hypothetical protein
LAFPYELDFGLDNFQKPKILNAKDSVAQIILNLFMMRPGSMPSMPHIGIDISSYLYMLEGDIDLEDLKTKIFSQCTDLLAFLSLGDIKIFFAPYNGQSVLVVALPIQGLDEKQDEVLLLGFTKDQNNGLLFNYQFEQGQIFN